MFLSIFTLIFLWGCSSSPRTMSKQEEVKSTIKTFAYQYGPTQANAGSGYIDKSEQYGLKNIKAVRFNVIDFNNDGHSDLVVLPTNYSQPKFYQYNPVTKKFFSVEDLFAESVVASYILFYDLDHDNVLDAITGVLNQKSELTALPLKVFKGKMIRGKIQFSEVKNAIPLKALPSTAVSLLDYDHDGFLDLYVGNWFGVYKDRPLPMKDYLFKGAGLTFTDSSYLLLGENEKNEEEFYYNAKPTYGVSTCDIDQNGFVDILTTSTSRFHNKLWMNLFTLKNNNRHFKNKAIESLYSSDVEARMDPRGGGRTFFSSCADYNNDGLMDIYMGELTHSYDPISVDKSSVLTGISKTSSPRFLRTEYMSDIDTINWNQGDRRATWFDFNFDGLIDLATDNSGFPPTSRMVLFEQMQNHAFENRAKTLGIDIINPTGTVVLDVNKDGKLDLITAQSSLRNTRIENRVYLFENNIPYGGNKILRFYPRGMRANSSALGAMVILKTIRRGQEYTKRQWVEYSQGAMPSQNEEGIVFGLERTEIPVRVSVRWPIAKSGRDKGRKPLFKSYNLNDLKFQYFLDLTLCESGRFYKGRKLCN